MKKATLAVVAGAVLGAWVSGCGSVRAIPERAGYPAEVPLGATLDIQVFREGTEIELTNTTARSFGPSVLWLNRWYARPLESLAPGEFKVLRLTEFEDRYGERFRAGGFFAIERPERLAVAELQTTTAEGQPILLPLVVVGSQEP